jgi:hypothetical protein
VVKVITWDGDVACERGKVGYGFVGNDDVAGMFIHQCYDGEICSRVLSIWHEIKLRVSSVD